MDGLNIDDLVAAAWPAPFSQDMAGWRLRHAGGVTKRANSVLPLGDPGPVDAAIERAERFYAELGLPTVFSVSGRACPAELDGMLADRGYALVDPTLAMIREIGEGGGGVAVDDTPSREWLDLWWSVDGRYPEQLPMAEKILTGVPAGYVMLDGVAVGRGVVQGEWLGIYSMAVAPEARRRGLARRVLRALLEWGSGRGCTRAYLLVVEENAAARALYASEGFEVAGGYHYRVK
ncbi:GNAT family N-acetyltransferase [Actinomadura rudentiformis]|uniref:GNAT family N-acetyltransferase n=1 Tax=Actinomadura rudentiformis TaxID=359158 RepID=A0A6H9YSV8_9ACTN|nr:GNAT family N-acetyltransferase [Actinomadura rudentiformis]KAB2346425.1 GNAT family N-acetyltransferase [Actinomadura rudentiformis]